MSKKRLSKDKKGSLQDILLITGAILAFAISILIGFWLTDALDTQFQSLDVVDDRGKAASTELKSFFPGVIDNSFLFFAIGINLVVLVLAALVRIHPIFLFFFFIGLVAVIFVAGIASNIYQEMAANEDLAPLADQLTFTSLTMEFLPFITGIFGFILMAVQYKLWRLNTG